MPLKFALSGKKKRRRRRKMQSAKEKISNMASAAKEHVTICVAKIDEQVEEARAMTEEEKKIAHEHRKVKEAQAKIELHQAKARHAEEKMRAKVSHHLPGHGTHSDPVVGQHGHRPVGTAAPMGAHAVTSYPLGGNPTPPGHMRHYQS